MSHGNGINELLIIEPSQAQHEICTHKGKQHITAAVKHRANLEERQKEPCKGKWHRSRSHPGQPPGNRQRAERACTQAPIANEHDDEDEAKEQRQLIDAEQGEKQGQSRGGDRYPVAQRFLT